VESILALLNFELFHINNTAVTPLALLISITIFSAGFWLGAHSRRFLNNIIHMRFGIPRNTAFAISTIVFYIIVVATIMMSLSAIGFDLRNVAIVAGALSVGIGLGLQSIANNFMSGLLLLFDRSIRVGDYIELGDELRGHIEEIRVRSTIIKTNDNVEMIVPNSRFMSEQVINWTLSDTIKRAHVPFSVAYGSDVDRLYEVILATAQTLPHVVLDRADFTPQLWFLEMGESSLNFELIVWVHRDAAVRPRGTRSVYLRHIHRALLDNQFEIPFPQRDLHIKSAVPLPFTQQGKEARE
jgi:small-conductance mechanosensitive channel